MGLSIYKMSKKNATFYNKRLHFFMLYDGKRWLDNKEKTKNPPGTEAFCFSPGGFLNNRLCSLGIFIVW